MRFVEIKKDGKILRHEIVKNKEVKKEIDGLSSCLAMEVEIEEGTTFKTIMGILLKEKEFFNKLFCEELKGAVLEDFEKQLSKRQNSKNNDGEDGEKLEFLEVAKMFELLTFEKGNTIDLFTIFVGIGKTPEEEFVYMPVSLSPINDIKNYEIVINKNVQIFQEKPDADEDDQVPVLVAICSISVYEMLQAILYEISYFTTPEDKLKQKKDLVKKIKMEDTLFELEQGLESAVKKEEYEKAARLKKELDRLKNKNYAKRKL